MVIKQFFVKAFVVFGLLAGLSGCKGFWECMLGAAINGAIDGAIDSAFDTHTYSHYECDFHDYEEEYSSYE
ncbi:MAG: hypothetical protein KDK66_06110, partial [Deltaproteobacteria bacterium]|nr:hypothetical protein [Deltaproteobacteria bacterium]